jgi:competence protein ComEC
MNLTLLSGLLVSLFVWLLGRRHYLYVWLAGAAIWGYVALCGASPSVVRAAVMASVFLLAEMSGRQKNGGPALLLTAAVMAWANPGVLWDASFQLSFLAMCGLIYIYPRLKQPAARLADKMAFWKGGWGYAVDSLAVSLSASLAVWPALAWHFGVVALAGPLATLLAAPLLPFIILAALAAAVAGLVWGALGQAIGLLLWLLTSCLWLIAVVFARLPSLETSLHPAALWGYYALLAIMLWWLARRKRRSLVEEIKTI